MLGSSKSLLGQMSMHLWGVCDAPGHAFSRCTVGLALLAGGLLNANAPGTVRNLPRAREGKRAAQKVGTDPMGNEYAPRTHVSACGGRWASVPRLAMTVGNTRNDGGVLHPGVRF